jgi:hypothetical protein
MLPLGLASMVKAYQMTDQGFTDSKGNVLPMEPSARDILAQAVGFNPAQNAEYNEARSDQKQRQACSFGSPPAAAPDRRRDGGRRPRHGARADPEGHGVRPANPAYGVLRGVEGSIKRRSRQQAVSERMKVPIGVSPKDIQRATAHAIRRR